MKPTSVAFALSVVAGLTYFVIFGEGAGYPIALASAAVGIFRLSTSFPLLINSKRSIGAVSVFSVIGLVYLALLLVTHPTFFIILPAVFEVGTLATTLYAVSRVGKTKQPSPLDMPVYG